MNIQPERAWQMALGQLQLDMPKASFDTWVKDTEFISFENGLLTVGVANAYASEWLSSRLTSTVSRFLAGILNQPVTVQFAVHEPSYDEEVEIEEESLDKGKPPEELTLQAEYQSIYDEIVQPEHVIVVPGYFLRYIPMLGVELSWQDKTRISSPNPGKRRRLSNMLCVSPRRSTCSWPHRPWMVCGERLPARPLPISKRRG